MEQRLHIHIVDHDPGNRAAFSRSIFELGHHAEVYENIEELTSHLPENGIILMHDNAEQGGVETLIERMGEQGTWLPVIAMAAHPEMKRIVAAMRSGAFDYLEQPLEEERLASVLTRVAREAEDLNRHRRRAVEARTRIAMLSNREREVLNLLAEGSSNKVIARELDISPRTVEIHRGNMMDKLGARHVAEAVRIQLEGAMIEWLH